MLCMHDIDRWVVYCCPRRQHMAPSEIFQWHHLLNAARSPTSCLRQNSVDEWPYWYMIPAFTLQWRHNEPNSVSNHQPHYFLLNYLFRRRSKKTPKLCVTGLCEGNSPVTGEFPLQKASNAENVSIWWSHHDKASFYKMWILPVSDRGSLDIRISVSELEAKCTTHVPQDASHRDSIASSSTGYVVCANRKVDAVQAQTHSDNYNPLSDPPCVSGPRHPTTDVRQTSAGKSEKTPNTRTKSSDPLPSTSSMRKRDGRGDEAMKNSNTNKCLKSEADVDMDIDEPSSDHFQTLDPPTSPLCQSLNCTCITELEARTHRIMKTAFERLDASTEQGNLEEASYWTLVINECFSWLERLKRVGVVPCGVRRGCVLLNVICTSREALDILWNRWVTGTIKLQLEEIFIPFLESEYSQSKVNIEIRICSHQYLRYWAKLDAHKRESLREDRDTLKFLCPSL